MNEFEFALQVLVIGFVVVLVTLALLYLLLQLFGLIFYRKDTRPGTGTAIPAKKSSAMPVDDDKKVMAVIMGAVYQYLQAEGAPATGAGLVFTVTPDEAAPGNSWKMYGRKALLNQRVELETIRRKKKRENF